MAERTGPSTYAARFGQTILYDGIAPVPNALFRYQARLGLGFDQVGLICAILSYRYTTAAPFPSFRRLARDSGVAKSSVFDLVAALVAKGLLTIEPRVLPNGDRGSNRYRLEPLFARIEELIRSEDDAPPDPLDLEPDGPEDADEGPRVSGIPDTVSGPPDGVSGHDRTPRPVMPGQGVRPEPDRRRLMEEDSMEEDRVARPNFRVLARRVSRALGAPGAWERLAGDFVNFAAAFGLGEDQVGRIADHALGCGPVDVADFWRWAELHRKTRYPTAERSPEPGEGRGHAV